MEAPNNMPITITEAKDSDSKLGVKKHLKSEIFNSRLSSHSKNNFVPDNRSDREPS